MKIALLSLVVVASFGLSYASESVRAEAMKTPKPELHHARPERKHPHHAEIARLHEEIKAKTLAYENDHAIAKSNPKDEKLQAKTIKEAHEIQALQQRLEDLKKAR